MTKEQLQIEAEKAYPLTGDLVTDFNSDNKGKQKAFIAGIQSEAAKEYWKPRWIPVEEGLPKIDENVLGFYTIAATDGKRKPTGEIFKYVEIVRIQSITEFGENKKSVNWIDKEYNPMNPTHWQPLPSTEI